MISILHNASAKHYGHVSGFRWIKYDNLEKIITILKVRDPDND